MECCNKCKEMKVLVMGKMCRDCKNAYERNRKRGTPEARAKTNKMQREALKKKRVVSSLMVDSSKLESCCLCNQKKPLHLFNRPYETDTWECIECFSSKCSRCNEVTELVKGKWCRECKNKYERERQMKPANKEKKRAASRELYQRQKQCKGGKTIDLSGHKACSVCLQEKALIHFHLNKPKGCVRPACKACEADKRKIYYEAHKQHISQTNTAYQNNRKRVDVAYKLERNMRCRLYHAIKNSNNVKHGTTMKLVGCTSADLKLHLEKQFHSGMTWENYGKWHVDHIKPCCQFNMVSAEEQQKCFHYSNLQPLWAIDNYRKAKKSTV